MDAKVMTTGENFRFERSSVEVCRGPHTSTIPAGEKAPESNQAEALARGGA